MSDLKSLATFEGPETFSRAQIWRWALSAGLSRPAADAFAKWLDVDWNQYDDGSGTLTNEDVLESALIERSGRG